MDDDDDDDDDVQEQRDEALEHVTLTPCCEPPLGVTEPAASGGCKNCRYDRTVENIIFTTYSHSKQLEKCVILAFYI